MSFVKFIRTIFFRNTSFHIVYTSFSTIYSIFIFLFSAKGLHRYSSPFSRFLDKHILSTCFSGFRTESPIILCLVTILLPFCFFFVVSASPKVYIKTPTGFPVGVFTGSVPASRRTGIGTAPGAGSAGRLSAV